MRGSDTVRSASGISAYRGRISDVWRQTAYRWYWLGNSAQGLGQFTQFLVIGWLVLEVTGSSAQLGLVVTLYGVPNVSFLLVAGVIADRFDRRHILLVSQGFSGGVIGALGFLTVAGLVEVWHIYAAAALIGAVQSIGQTARMTMIADLVEGRSILDAVAMQNAGVQAGRILGPPIAGVIIEVWGVDASLFVIAAWYIMSVTLVAKIGPVRRALPVQGQSPLRNFADGLAYIKNSPLILTVIIISTTFGAFGMPHLQVVPALAKEVLGSGAADVGLLYLGSGIGSLIGSLILPLIGRPHVYRSLLICLVVFTVVLSLFSWSTSFWISWALFFLLGVIAIGMIWPLATTMIQMESARDVRGRVMGILQFTPGLHFVGAFPLALAAGQFGWGAAITASAVVSLSVTAWFALVRPGAPKLRAVEASKAAGP